MSIKNLETRVLLDMKSKLENYFKIYKDADELVKFDWNDKKSLYSMICNELNNR